MKFDGYIFCNRMAYYPAMQMRDCMEEISKIRLLCTHRPERLRKRVVIRFGNSQPIPDGVLDTDINTPEAIATMADKRKFSVLMQAHEIPSPVFYRNNMPEEFPVLIRETLTGFGGKGIYLIKSMEEFTDTWNTNCWWTPFVSMRYELRAHVIGGQIVKAFVKKALNSDEVILTNDNSHWVRINNPTEEGKWGKMRETVEKVNAVLGAKFFGLDLGWDTKNKRYFVLEANSAPGGNLSSSKLYASSLLDLLGIEHARIDWAIEDTE